MNRKMSNSMFDESERMATCVPFAPVSASAGRAARYFFSPATDIAPAGSSIARVSSKQSRTAAQISSFETVTTSSTSSLHSRNTSGPTHCTAAPSTKCGGSVSETRWPVLSDCRSTSKSSGSTPITFVVGESLRSRSERSMLHVAGSASTHLMRNRLARIGQLVAVHVSGHVSTSSTFSLRPGQSPSAL